MVYVAAEPMELKEGALIERCGCGEGRVGCSAARDGSSEERKKLQRQ